MSVDFLRWLDRVRERAGVRFEITSDFRPGDPGHHGRGDSVDLNSRIWNAAQKWNVNAAIILLAPEAPGKVEFEPVYDHNGDQHWHVAVDRRPGARHEFVEADD